MSMTGADDLPVVAGQTIGQLALVVRDYDEAIHFYVDVLGFTLIEDTVIPAQGKRWVIVAHGVRPGHACCLRAPRTMSRRRVSEIKPAAASFCSSTPTISGATFMLTRPRASSLFGSQRQKTTARLPSSRISTATCGIYFNLTRERRHDRTQCRAGRTRW